ncbi:D-alanyl-D-alanine carboxypeptidase [Streptomyces sp. NPDC049915]|uniref:D-alanyl-D-alanine carboxypeptidase n=1 Tax=Streptomyces sp. NPDC049915 TaxID=3155510 RepID=UPI00341B106B
MAGESPDRSKQRESSAEPTPGSATSVPEARNERSGDSAAGGPDPRLAVAREADPPRGGVDTATRVLSVRDLAEDAGESEADGGSEAGSEGASAGDSEGTSEGDSEGTSEGGADGEETAAAPEDDASDDAPRGEASEREASDDDAPEDEVPEDNAPEDETPADDAPKDAAPKVEAPDGDASGTDGDAPGTEGDARLREAVAAWVRSADSDGGPAQAKGSEGPEKAAKAPAEGAEGASADAGAPEKDAEGEKADSRTADEADASADAEDAEDAPEDTPVGKGGDQPTTMLKIGDAPKARVGKGNIDQPTTMLKLGDVKPKPAGQPKDAEDSTSGKDAQAGTSAKDGKSKDTPSDKAPEDAKPAESEAERTSKFVALKPLDDPSTRKPPRPAQPPVSEATTALRRVTPDAKPAGAKPTPAPAPAPAEPKAAAPKAAPAEATAAIPQAGPERTTQQPLPPKPPLDLLAELTNTPPPPQTPLRRVVRRVKIWTPLVLLLVIVFAIAQAVRPLPTPALDLTAQDSYTFDGGKATIPWPASGQAALDVQGIGTFGSSGDQKPVPIASVAKVMTAYIVLRDHPLESGADGPKIGIDKTAEAQSDAGQESTVHVTAGDSITEREALESILIASANNVARLLARWDSGSEQAFVAKMNATAKSLGMADTTYTDPSGLNNTTVSTAVDQVKLAKQAMEQPAFREVAAMMEYVDYKGVKHPNWNGLVGHNHVVGIKTGTTTSALGNLVFAAKKDVNGVSRRIVGAVVRQPAGGPENTILSAALDGGDKLIRGAQAALQSRTILKKGDVVGYVDDGVGGRTPVVVTQNVTAVGWAGLKVKLSFAADALPHTAKAGTKVGTLTVGDGSSEAVKVPVALQKDLTEPGFAAKLTRLG